MYEFIVLGGQTKPKAWVDDNGRITTRDFPGKEVELDKFSMGGLKGFIMALQDLETQGIKMQFRDSVTIECIGMQQNEDSRKDDMVLFEVTIDR